MMEDYYKINKEAWNARFLGRSYTNGKVFERGIRTECVILLLQHLRCTYRIARATV